MTEMRVFQYASKFSALNRRLTEQLNSTEWTTSAAIISRRIKEIALELRELANLTILRLNLNVLLFCANTGKTELAAC